MGSVEESYRGDRVRVFRLDRERLLAALRDRAGRLVAENPEVLEVRLIGSLARDQAKPGSDADLLVRVTDHSASLPDRTAFVARAFEGTGIGCDVLVYTDSEWERLRREERRIVRTALAEGILLARR